MSVQWMHSLPCGRTACAELCGSPRHCDLTVRSGRLCGKREQSIAQHRACLLYTSPSPRD
eukprot:4024889-Alexandrium_andersonii.AAC.1